MNIAVLQKVNLSSKEINVYLKLLECGASSVRRLADLSGLNRGTVYDILKKLQSRGLISYYHKESRRKFVAEDPEKLQQVVGEEENKFKKIRENIAALIPELRSLQNKGGSKPTTKFYEGKKGIRHILDDVLSVVSRQKNKEYFIYSATDVSGDINGAYPDFTRIRIKKKIKVKAISLARGGKIHGLDERRWLGSREKSATYIFIYSDKCAFISRDVGGLPVGVIIENKMISETQRIIFLRLWELLK